MLRWTIDTATRGVARLTRNQKIEVNGTDTKVNLGSGLEVAPGWINIDASIHAAMSALPDRVAGWGHRLSGSREVYEPDEYLSRLKNHRFVLHDLRYGIPLGDATASYMYIGHVLQDMVRDEIETLLHDAARVLKPGGTLRITGPDLEGLVNQYRAGDKHAAVRRLLGATGRTHLNQNRYLFDFSMLEEMLKDAGFKTVTRRAFREGDVPDLALIEKPRPTALYVEATH